MTSSDLEVPANTCEYERYEPFNLTPSNQSTCTRLNELDWSAEQFMNKSVLDIGCHSGIYSLYANKLGARSVCAVDVQAQFTDFFTSVVSTHNLPIQVEKLDFNELEPAKHAADIVLCMEVLHCIVDQDGTVADAIYKLATLTNDTLFVETPWDINETSISKQGEIRPEQYNMELVCRELQKYFEHVQLSRFTSYFDDTGNSKRLLIQASGKREHFEFMRGLTNVNPLNISLTKGTNPLQLMTSVHGPVILKTLPQESVLPALDTPIANQLFDTLSSTEGHVLAALSFGDNYIFETATGEHLMMFPFVGHLGDYFQNESNHGPVSNPLRLAVECRRTLSRIPDNVVMAIKDKSKPIVLKGRNELGIFFNHLIDTHGLTGFIDDVFEFNEHQDRGAENCVVHNDLQLGNMITDNSGKDWILDLDILRSGTAYSDFICCAIFNNSPKESVLELYNEMVQINGRHIQLTDMYFSMNIVLRWIYTLNTYHKSALAELGEPAVLGIKTLHSIVMVENTEYKNASQLPSMPEYS